MFVRNWMSSPVLTLPAFTPVAHALEFMRSHDIGRLPVVEAGALVGIVTHTDLEKYLGVGPGASLGTDATLKDLMRTRVVTVSPGDTIEHATAVMLERGVAGLPVVENHRVVGIIAESDIFRAFNEIMGNGQRGARIVFMIDADADLAEQLHRRLHGKAVSTLVVRRLASGVREVVARVAGPDTSLLRREVEAATPR